MKAGRIQTIKIIILCLLYTAYTCGRAIIKSMRGTITRQWCDEELQRWIHRLLKVVRVQNRIINPYHTKPPEHKPTIIMCNHTSLYDIPLSLTAFPKHSVRMLAKKELASIPIMGGGMVAAEFPFIDRKNRRQAIKDLETVKKSLVSGIVMWIAPEGTRSKDGKLHEFKKGAFITAISMGATIIPIGIRGANHILPAKSHHFNLDQHTEIHIGEAIDAAQYTMADKDLLLNKVYQIMRDLVGETA